MPKKILTQEDVDSDPSLAGYQPGDEIETNDNEQTLTDDDDTGGTIPPPGKKRP